VASITVISILLLFTIAILSASISIANVFNADLKENNLSDFTLRSPYYSYAVYTEKQTDLQKLVDNEAFGQYVKEFMLYNLYQDDTITFDTLLTPAAKNALLKTDTTIRLDKKLPIMRESDFHQLMKIFRTEDLIIDIDAQHYLIAGNLAQMVGHYLPTLQGNVSLTLQGQTLTPAYNQVLITAIENTNHANNAGLLIVDDSLLTSAEIKETKIVGNYVDSGSIEQIESAFRKFVARTLNENDTVDLLVTK
jgi:putative ABC transport system permease protein